MTAALVALAILLLVVAAVLLARLLAENRRQENLVRRVRTTDLYGHLYPMLRRYDNEYVESVAIRLEGVFIRTLVPLGGEARYTFRKHGLDEPSPETLYALAQAVLVDMRTLRATQHYTFRSHTETRPNGDKAEWYDYVITSARKDAVLRAEAKRRA